jgi:hypothetical protein
MLILASATDKLRVVTGAAGTISVHASWLDNVSGAVNPGRTNTSITTATTTDVVPSPAAGVFRNIKTLHIHNGGSASNDVTVLHTDGTTTVELYKTRLAAGDTLQYVDEIGFKSVVAGVVGSRVLLKEFQITAVPQLVIGPEVLLNSGYTVFEAEFYLKHTAAGDDFMLAQVSQDSGATYLSGASSYAYTQFLMNSGNVAGPLGFAGVPAAAYIPVSGPTGVGQTAVGSFEFIQALSGDVARIATEATTYSSTNAWGQFAEYIEGGAWGAAHLPVTNMRLYWNTGANFANGFGYLKVYGLT